MSDGGAGPRAGGGPLCGVVPLGAAQRERGGRPRSSGSVQWPPGRVLASHARLSEESICVNVVAADGDNLLSFHHNATKSPCASASSVVEADRAGADCPAHRRGNQGCGAGVPPPAHPRGGWGPVPGLCGWAPCVPETLRAPEPGVCPSPQGASRANAIWRAASALLRFGDSLTPSNRNN